MDTVLLIDGENLKGIGYTTRRTILIRNSELFEFEIVQPKLI